MGKSRFKTNKQINERVIHYNSIETVSVVLQLIKAEKNEIFLSEHF